MEEEKELYTTAIRRSNWRIDDASNRHGQIHDGTSLKHLCLGIVVGQEVQRVRPSVCKGWRCVLQSSVIETAALAWAIACLGFCKGIFQVDGIGRALSRRQAACQLNDCWFWTHAMWTQNSCRCETCHVSCKQGWAVTSDAFKPPLTQLSANSLSCAHSHGFYKLPPSKHKCLF